MIARPDKREYVDYYEQYVSKVPEGDILELLEHINTDTMKVLRGLGEEQASYRYSPGKWSVKQVVGHVSDIERVFAYRAFVFARGDKTALPSIEQDDYVAGANFDDRTLQDILDEFKTVRAGSLALFRSLDPDIIMRTGTASGFRFTVRSIPFILVGHELHHMAVLKDRYL